MNTQVTERLAYFFTARETAEQPWTNCPQKTIPAGYVEIKWLKGEGS